MATASFAGQGTTTVPRLTPAEMETFLLEARVTDSKDAGAGVTLVDARSRTMQALDDMEKNSVDYYSALRSAYTQRRVAELRQKGAPQTAPIPLVASGRPDLAFAG